MKYYGKEKCRILKEIRAEIARQNDIEWVVSECKHQGNCKGTCPKCEQEVRKLEKALERREALGKRVAVVGVSASIALSVTGCVNPFSQTTAGTPLPETGDSLPPNTESESLHETSAQGEEVVTEMGELIVPGEETTEETTEFETMENLMGELVDGEFLEETTEPETEEPLMGDPVVEGEYPEESTDDERETALIRPPLAGMPVFEEDTDWDEDEYEDEDDSLMDFDEYETAKMDPIILGQAPDAEE